VKRIVVAVALLFIQCFPAGAADPNCMNENYYRNRLPSCIDDMLSPLRASGSKADPNTVIGFLAQLFSTSPEERQRLLENEPSDYVRSVELVALYRADLLDDAQRFSIKNNLSALLQKLQASRPAPLAAVRPSSVPADNDLLIGAYMASGDKAFIQRIIDNYSSADDAMASDGFRVGLMLSKFGPGLTPKGRDSVMMQAICAKYQCKTDQAKFLRVTTLATAFWSLQSLSGKDDGIRKMLSDFFARDTRLDTLFKIEQTAFGNYLVYIIAVTAIKDDQPGANRENLAAMRNSVSIYENLGPANEAFAPFAGQKK
jgi:hypothetical protein